jgi:peptidoglycan/xylan/chitin deacetylase (PgdA/CDA1 family)
VLAEALRIVTAAGGQVLTDTTTVFYADASAGFLGASDRLIGDDGMRALFTRVVQALKVAAGSPEPRMQADLGAFPLPQLRAWFSNLTFAPDGSLVLRVPETFSLPELSGFGEAATPSPRIVTVASVHAVPLLTDVGRRVQSALASGDPLVLPTAPSPGHEDIDCSLLACVALTFDDGPSAFTTAVLDALGSRRAAATFFLQGVYVERHPDAVARMHAEGHQIGNHTWSHSDLTTLSAAEVADQLERTNAVITSITGSAPTVFRPPYGAYNESVLAQAAVPAILWSLDTRDWRKPGDQALLDRAVGGSRPGDIVLLHDVHESTVRVVPQIIDGLLGRGFTLVTVEQLLGGNPMPGTATRR